MFKALCSKKIRSCIITDYLWKFILQIYSYYQKLSKNQKYLIFFEKTDVQHLISFFTTIADLISKTNL